MLDPVVDSHDESLLKALPFLNLKLGRTSRVLNELPNRAFKKLEKQVGRQPSLLGLNQRLLNREKLEKYFIVVSKKRRL